MDKNWITQEQLNRLNYIDLALKTRKTPKQREAIQLKEIEKLNRNVAKLKAKLEKRRLKNPMFTSYNRKQVPLKNLTEAIIDENIAFGFEYN